MAALPVLAMPGTITSTCNSNVLSSTEANAIYIVLGEISSLLQRYECNIEKVAKGKAKFEHWERSFLLKNVLCASLN